MRQKVAMNRRSSTLRVAAIDRSTVQCKSQFASIAFDDSAMTHSTLRLAHPHSRASACASMRIWGVGRIGAGIDQAVLHAES